MGIKIGCDLVHVKKFKESVRRGGEIFLNNIFSARELAGNPTVETLAGMFAAKEAVVKALELRAGEWEKTEIVKNKSGRPEAKVLDLDKSIVSQDISISHDGEYAIAVSIILLK